MSIKEREDTLREVERFYKTLQITQVQEPTKNDHHPKFITPFEYQRQPWDVHDTSRVASNQSK